MERLGKQKKIMSSHNNTYDSVSLPIRQAALGYISGTLEEWPLLDQELRKHGVILPASTRSETCRKACLRILKEHG